MAPRISAWILTRHLGVCAIALAGCGWLGGSADTDAGSGAPTAFDWSFLEEDTDAPATAEAPPTVEDLSPSAASLGDLGAAPAAVAFTLRSPFLADVDEGPAPEGTEVQVDPPVPGTVTVRDARTLVFTPTHGFAPEQAYQVRLVAVSDGTTTLRAPAPDAWSHRFETPPLRFLRTVPVEVGDGWRYLGLHLVFSGPVDLSGARAATRIEKDGRGVGLGEWRRVEGQPNRVFVAATGPFDSEGRVRTTVRDGFASDGEVAPGIEGAGSSYDWDFDPDRPDVSIESVHLVEGTNRFSIDVICDDAASEGYKRWMWVDAISESFRVSPRCLPTDAAADRFIEVSPPVPFEVVPTRGGFRLIGDFPRGNVKVSLRPGLSTVDGGILASSREAELTVPALSPSVSFTTQGRYLPRDAWARLPVQHRNVDALQVRIRHIPERNLAFWLSGEDEAASERVSDLVVDEEIPVRGTPDARTTTWIDVARLLPDATDGVYQVEVEGAGARASARLLLTDLNLVVKGSSLAAGRDLKVWALGMEDGANQAGVSIRAIRPSGRTLATCTTNGDGCVLSLPEDEVGEERPMALVATRGDDLTYLRFDDLQAPLSEVLVQGEAYDSDRAYRASLWTERGVFRPGETAHVAGVVRGRDHRAPPAGMPVDLDVRDPRGKLIRTLATTTNAAGAFEVDVPFADYANTGAWDVEARAGQQALGQVRFAVEEFVPERMEVEATVDGTDHLVTDPLPVTTEARYLFGGSAADHQVELSCRLEPVRFRPTGEGSGYTFGEPLTGHAARPVELGRVTGRLGEDGSGELACPELGRASAVHGAARLVADVAVFEAGSGRTSKATATATVHGAPYHLGLRTGVEKVEAGQAFTVEGVVVDWAGERVTDVDEVTLTLQAQETEWAYAWDPERGREAMQQVLRSLPGTPETVPVEDGRFRITLTAADDAERFQVVAETDATRTALGVEGTQRWWWWGEGERDRDATPKPLAPTEVALELPEALEVGTETRVGFTAPFQGRALVTVETDRVLRSEWMPVEAGPVDWSFTLGEFVDNVYVSVLVVKDPHLESEAAFLPDRAFGAGSIRVTPTRFTGALDLQVAEEVRSDSTLDVTVDLGPGEGTRYVTVAAVDEGILSLTDFQTPDPRDDLFPTRALGVKTWETIGWALHLQPPGASSSTGGDGMADLGGGRVQMVEPVSLWSGLVAVPEDGRKTLSLPVPRYRGKLRVMAVAVGEETTASAEASVVVRDPVVLQTTLPRFLVAGDEAEIPVFLTNMSGRDRDVTVQLRAETLPGPGQAGVGREEEPLDFEGARQATLSLPDGESTTAVFRVRNQLAAGGIRLQVVATSGDLEVSESMQLPVLADGPTERMTQVIPLEGPPVALDPLLTGWVPGSEHTTVWVTNNPYGRAYSHLSYVIRYPYGCIEQTTSSTRPLLYVGNVLEATDPRMAADSRIPDMVDHGVERLMNMQTPSGGFAYWMGGSQPTTWGTAYATHLLLDAREAGFEVPERNLEDAIDWLERTAQGKADARDPYHAGVSPGGAAYVHYVLALAGRPQTAAMQTLLATMGDPTDGPTAEARYLLQAGLYLAGDRRHEAALRRLDTSPISERRRNDWTFYSDLRRRGFMLGVYADLFGSDGADGLASRVADALGERGPRRVTTQDVAWGLTGLGKVLDDLPQDYTVRLRHRGTPVKPDEVSAGTGTDALTWTLWRGSELGDLDLRVEKKGSGKLYAVINSEGVRQGASWSTGGRSLSVRRAFLDHEGDPVDLARVELGDLVYVRTTLSNTSRERIQNIALVDRVPAGWEIENPRLGASTGAPWIDDGRSWGADNLNVRDDRLEVFGTLDGGASVEVVYAVRAVTAGTFSLPPVNAEAMYDPDVWAREAGDVVVIGGPWAGSYL